MSQPPMWLTIEPRIPYTQLLLSQAGVGTVMRARLSPMPAQPAGVAMFLEALSAWQGMPLFAVLDADAEEVQRCPEKWARLVGEVDQHPHITVEWSAPGRGRLWRDRFFEEMRGFDSSKRLMKHAVTGQR